MKRGVLLKGFRRSGGDHDDTLKQSTKEGVFELKAPRARCIDLQLVIL